VTSARPSWWALVLAVLAADHQATAATWQRALLILAGCGTALVLTGGNLYLAHAIAWVRRWRAGLVVVWLVVLASTGGLVVPLIAAGIGGRTLPQVLDRHLRPQALACRRPEARAQPPQLVTRACKSLGSQPLPSRPVICRPSFAYALTSCGSFSGHRGRAGCVVVVFEERQA